jgi:hypothetical protein
MGVVIGYNNFLDTADTITASSAGANTPFANAFDGLVFDFYEPASAGTVTVDVALASPAEADYFAFYGTNLSTNGGSIKLQYDNGAGYVDAFTAVSPTTTAPHMEEFTAVTSDTWRIVIDSTPTSRFAAISFGKKTTSERGLYIGFTTPLAGRAVRYTSNLSENGTFLGRSVLSRYNQVNANFEFMSDSFVKTTWLPFIAHAEKKPFFFKWSTTDNAAETMYAWTSGQSIPEPRITNYGFQAVTLPIEGYTE